MNLVRKALYGGWLQVDVDLVLSEGSVVYGAITDNWPTIEPYFNETGSNCPSILPREQQAGLMELGVQSVNALGLSCVSPSLHLTRQHHLPPSQHKLL